MLTLFLALLLVVTPAPVGTVHVLVEPGDAIFLDGKQVGVSGAAAGGLVIESVPVGGHEIVVRTPSGGSAAAKFNVALGLTSRVTISSLGLRTRARGDDASIEMQIASDPVKCELTVGTDKTVGSSEDLRMDHIRPGRQKVALACGGKHAAGDIDVPAGKTITVHADLAAGKLQVVNERSRVISVYVPTVADAIMRLDLPFTWKRAIAASLVPGVTPKSITRNGILRVDVTLTAATWQPLEDVAANLKERREVASIYSDYSGSGYTRDGSVQYTYIITFRSGE